MSPELPTNKMRLSVLITTIFATIFAIIMLFFFYRPGWVGAGNGLSSSGLESPIILIEASILAFIALLGSLLIILKMKYF